MRRPVRAAVWLLGLTATAATLRAAGTGALAPPPVGSGGDLLDWVDGRAPSTAALGLVRLTAELAAWYLLALSAMRAAAVLRLPSADRFADRISVPGSRWVVRVGLGVAATWSLPTGTDVLVPRAGAVPVELAPVQPTGTATMRPVTPPDTGSAPTGTATMRPVVDRPAPVGTTGVPVPLTWTVAPGECFWSVAAELVSGALSRPATDREVLAYWVRLIETNRGRLVDPADPDLILPGQVLEVPPVTAPLRG